MRDRSTPATPATPGRGPAVLLLALLCLAPGVARAEEAPPAAAAPAAGGAPGAGRVDEAQMRDAMHRYFTGERRGGIWLMGVAAPTMALGAGLMFHPDDFARGLAYSMFAVGVIELVGGVTFYLNSKRRVPRFDGLLGSAPAAYREEELKRIHRVHREMHLLEAVELSLIMAGGVMTCAGALQKEYLLAGIGTGVMIQAGVLLLYDQLAARRARRYDDSLTRFGVSLTGGPGQGPSGALLTMQRPF